MPTTERSPSSPSWRNLQREDLNVIEEAMAYQGLIDMGMTMEEIATKMGIKQSWRIQERLNLLKLDRVFQDYTVKGILSPSQAQELSRLPKSQQGIVFDKIASGKANSYNKLRSLVNAMLFVVEQTSFLPEPTEEEKKMNSKYDIMIERLATFINRSFKRDDLTVLASILTPRRGSTSNGSTRSFIVSTRSKRPFSRRKAPGKCTNRNPWRFIDENFLFSAQGIAKEPDAVSIARYAPRWWDPDDVTSPLPLRRICFDDRRKVSPGRITSGSTISFWKPWIPRRYGRTSRTRRCAATSGRVKTATGAWWLPGWKRRWE
jgi:hypothetical protein